MNRKASERELHCLISREGREAGKGNIRNLVLVLAVCLIGLAGIIWFYDGVNRRVVGADSDPRVQQSVLTESTRAVLQRLDAPVQIRFYGLLDPASVPVSVQQFAVHVDELLSEYQREAGAKIEVTRYISRSEIKAAALAAEADGLKPFNLDKGDACYFGLVVAQDDRMEALQHLAPEWQQALEFDLTRAIEQVARGKAPAPRAANTPPATLAATEEVKRVIPNFGSISMGEGTRILRAAALKDFRETVAAMEVEVAEAQQSLSQAQNGGSEDEQQAAWKRLQQVQSARTEKLQQIAARSAAHVEALRQLKEAAH